jgi:hypothetical protein
MARSFVRGGLGLAVLAVVAVVGTGGTPVPQDKLPEPVAKTFQTLFPNGVIDQLDSEEENGVMVFDFEFHAGGREKEADIAADGTMMESTLVITRKEFPAAAMKRIQLAAKGARIGRCEWMESRYEPEAGKLVALPKPMIKYAAEMTRGGKSAEIIVTADGKVVEAPEWVPITAAPAPAGK